MTEFSKEQGRWENRQKVITAGEKMGAVVIGEPDNPIGFATRHPRWPQRAEVPSPERANLTPRDRRSDPGRI